MTTLSVTTWIGNAAAVLNGPWGAITAHAHQAGCSRQTAYEHAQRVAQAVADAQAGGPARAQLQADCQRLADENRQLWQALDDAVLFGTPQQQRFAATAAALGLSLGQTRALLACVLPAAACPSRARLGRWVQQAARRAGAVLDVLDAACQTAVRTLCLDEIFFHRQTILVGVEPHSLAWVLGQRAPDRSGGSWHQALRVWPQLEYVAADGGTGLHVGLEQVRTDRVQARTGPDLEVALDVFHTQRDGAKALRAEWAAAERVWEEAEAADRDLARTSRQGKDRRGDKQRSLRAWAKAEEAFGVAQQREAAWQRAQGALHLFRPDGRLNDRAAAAAAIDQAVADLAGGRWAKVRRMLQDRRSLTFLDRLQRDVATAEPRAELRAALVELWRLRHASRPGCGPLAAGVCGQVTVSLQALICQRLDPAWHGAYRRVARVLERVVRASSVVECMNSVLRMHQARHRGVSQGLLDLKRLYWNCRAFVEGKHRGQCPYAHLGLSLPTFDWWQLLHTEVQHVREKVSTGKQAA
jgi:hypothetical protein